jgi:hypothetical protein
MELWRIMRARHESGQSAGTRPVVTSAGFTKLISYLFAASYA